MSPRSCPASRRRRRSGRTCRIGLPWPDGPDVVADGTPGAIWLRGVVTDGAGDPVPDALIETWQADPAGGFDHPDDPRGAGARIRLPRLRPLPDRRRRAVRDPDPQARPGARPGRAPAGAARRLSGLRPRAAAPGGDPDLLRRRAGGQRRRPGARLGVPNERRATLIASARRATATGSTSGCRATMRPSSSPSEPGGLFDGVLAAGPVRAAVDDEAWLRAMLDVEAALARAQARVGTVPAAAAEAITAACAAARGEPAFDPAALGAAAAGSGNPVIPLVRALRDAVAAASRRPRCRAGRGAVGSEAAAYVHAGATSQDILDTAAMLVARRALDRPPRRPDRGSRHRGGPGRHPPGHTGGRADPAPAGPADDVRPGGRRLAHRPGRRRGPAGRRPGRSGRTARRCRRDAGRVRAGRARRGHRRWPQELGLAAPVLPWHTDRTRVAELAGALGLAAGTLGKIARDVTLYAQTEVAESRAG